MRLFVHIPKNGGMSIRKGVPDRIIVASEGNHVSKEYTEAVRQTMEAHGEHHGFEHARLRDFRKDLREQYRAFAIVRNPWARCVSRYTFSRLHEDRYSSFRHFLDDRHEHGGLEYFWHRAIRGWYPQVDYIKGGCDVLRFGTDDVQRYLGLKNPLPIRNVSNKREDYRDFYGPEEYDIVSEWYAEDIDYFGFTFESRATRNTWKPMS